MNRCREGRARSWVHWAGLCAALLAILAVWGLWPAEPAWLIVGSLGAAWGALFVVEARQRREPLPRGPVEDLGPPSGATVAEFLAAAEARYGNGGAASGAAVPGRLALWNGEPLPPMPPARRAADPCPRHPGDYHSGCPACQAFAADLADWTGAHAEAAMIRQCAAYRAPWHATATCGAGFGPHVCERRGPHEGHRCECGTVWGTASFLGEPYPYISKPIPGRPE